MSSPVLSSMETRYTLRFESGERRGELVPIRGARITLGRRPGNAVQILDSSVSGRHAELVVDERGTLLRDLGSTNGTRVGEERISERQLAHGDQILLGNVRMTFLDGTLDPTPLSTEPAPPLDAGPKASGTAAAAGEAVRTISAERVARAGRRSIAAGLFAVLLVGGIAAAWFLWRPFGETERPVRARSVTAVAGNLLASSYSFEQGAWESEESAPATFDSDTAARYSGKLGLRADLSGGAWARASSEEISVSAGRALYAEAVVRAEAGVTVALALVFVTRDAHAPAEAWSKTVTDTADFETLSVTAAVPRSFDRARLVVLARRTSEGEDTLSCDIDDASVTPADSAGALFEHKSFQVAPLGEPVQELLVAKLERPLVSALRFFTAPVPAGAPEGQAALTYTPSDTAIALAAEPSAGALGLRLLVEPDQLTKGLATTGAGGAGGAGGYRTHQSGFERAQVGSVLIGAGQDLVRLAFDAPRTVRGRPVGQDGGGFVLEVPDCTSGVTLQLSFTEERLAAENFQRDAQDARQRGNLGASLALWGKIVDEVPVNAELVQTAEAARAELTEQGMKVVSELKLEFERARFFRLVDIFRECKQKAERCATDYAGSEVETAVRELLAEIDKELGQLEAELDVYEVQRLKAILKVLEASDAKLLAERVRTVLRETYKTEP